jgi:hypothetical protein
MSPEEAAPIHRKLFTEFCRIEMDAGGPDPQVKLTAEAIKAHPIGGPELAGLFVVPYTCAGAALLWRLWERKPDPMSWGPWLEQHGKGLPIRKERRPVKGSWPRFMTCASGWLRWCEGRYEEMKDRSYAEVLKSVTDEVPYFGRYATMKLLETMYQADLMSSPQNTIVPRDAKFPRRSMALMMPEHEHLLTDKKLLTDRNASRDVDELAERIRQGIIMRLEVPVSWFQIETMFCIYGQTLRGKYAAGRHDSELGHWGKAIGHYGLEGGDAMQEQFDFYGLRSRLYPHQYLGERGDPSWWGVRPELEEQQMEVVRALGLA